MTKTTSNLFYIKRFMYHSLIAIVYVHCIMGFVYSAGIHIPFTLNMINGRMIYQMAVQCFPFQSLPGAEQDERLTNQLKYVFIHSHVYFQKNLLQF